MKVLLWFAMVVVALVVVEASNAVSRRRKVLHVTRHNQIVAQERSLSSGTQPGTKSYKTPTGDKKSMVEEQKQIQEINPIQPVAISKEMKTFARDLYNRVFNRIEEDDEEKQFGFLILQTPKVQDAVTGNWLYWNPVFLNQYVEDFMQRPKRTHSQITYYTFPSLLDGGIWPYSYTVSRSNFAVSGVAENKEDENKGRDHCSIHSEYKLIAKAKEDMVDYYDEETNGECPAFILLASKLDTCCAPEGRNYQRCTDYYIDWKNDFANSCQSTVFYVYVQSPSGMAPPNSRETYWDIAKRKYCRAGIGIITYTDDDAAIASC